MPEQMQRLKEQILELHRKGKIQLTEHAGLLGVWAKGENGRIFVAPREVNLATPWLDSRTDDSGVHVAAWAVAHDKHTDPFVQIHFDRGSGRILNWDKIKNALKFETSSVTLSEKVFLKLFGQEEEDAFWNHREVHDQHADELISDFLRDPDKPQKWDVFPAAKLKRLWQDHAKYGFVRDEKGLNDLADHLVRNTSRLQVNGELGGHEQGSPRDFLEHYGYDGNRWTDEHDEKFGDHITDPETGAWRLSDHAMKGLYGDAMELHHEKDPNKRILIADRLLNRVHPRSDIAGLYVEGGSRTLNELRDHGTNLSEDVDLSAPALREGDKWVTLKPHGPDSPDYVRVIIREHKDGSAHVVWAGHKGLLNLKLNKLGSSTNKPAPTKPLSPEEVEARNKRKEEKQKAVEGEKEAFGKTLAKTLGLKDEHGKKIAEALGNRHLSGSQDEKPKDKDLERERRAERNRKIVTGEAPEVAPASPMNAMPLGKALSVLSSSDLDGSPAPSLSDMDPEIQQAWETVRQNPEVMRQIAGMHSQHRSAIRDISKADPDEAPVKMDIGERIARYEDDAAGQDSLLKGARERATYASHSKFWEQASNPELGAGAHEAFLTGAVDALNMAAQNFSGAGTLDASAVRLVGPELAAAAVAAKIGEGRRKAASERIERDIAARSLPTVEQAMEIAKESDAQRDVLRNSPASDDLSDATRVAALKNEVARKQMALGRAAGSLETAALIAHHLRTGLDGGLFVRSGEHTDEVQARLARVGVAPSQYSLEHDDQGVLGIRVSQQALAGLGRTLEGHSLSDGENQAIKRHERNEADYRSPHLNPAYTPKDSQQAFARFAIKNKKTYGNLGVGIGKTLTAGMIVDELLSSGELENNLAWYIVPTNLIGETMRQLKTLFPGLKIDSNHSDFSTSVTGGDRAAGYRADEKPNILVMGQDTVRQDADVLSAVCRDREHRPGMIVGDEVQAMFTPGPKDAMEDQSQRTRAINGLHAKYQVALTGTPIRRSAVEVWKVLNWLRPGEFGTAKSWAKKYGRVGEGVSAWSDASNRAFQNEVDHVLMTEREAAPVEYRTNEVNIPLSDRQRELYHGAELEHAGRVATGADARRSLSEKIGTQRKAVYETPIEHNPILQQTVRDVTRHVRKGERGIIHCTTIGAVQAVANAFPKGSILTFTGGDNAKRRGQIVSAINDGTPIVGGRVRVPGGAEGVVSAIKGDKLTVSGDQGGTFEVPAHEAHSLVVAVAGTSRATGVLSTGLNLQKGTTFSIHYQLPDSGATYTQREARNLRTGQTRSVTSYTYLPDLPNVRGNWNRIKQGIEMNNSLDADKLDEQGLIPRSHELEPQVTLSDYVYLADVKLHKIEGHIHTPRQHVDRTVAGKVHPVEKRELGEGVYVWHGTRLPHHPDYHDQAVISVRGKGLKLLEIPHGIDPKSHPELRGRGRVDTLARAKGYDGIRQLDEYGNPHVDVVFDGRKVSDGRKLIAHLTPDEQKVYSVVPHGASSIPEERGDYGLGTYLLHKRADLPGEYNTDELTHARANVDATSRLLRISENENLFDAPELKSRVAEDAIRAAREASKAGDHNAIPTLLREAGYHGIQEMGAGGPTRSVLFDKDRVLNHVVEPMKPGSVRDKWSVANPSEPRSFAAPFVQNPGENIRNRLLWGSNPREVRQGRHRFEYQDADGKIKSITFGQKTFQDWKDTILQHMTPEEALKAAHWYERVNELFSQIYPAHEVPKKMAAWLASQQRTSPQSGMQFVLQAEGILHGLNFFKTDQKGDIVRDADGKPILKVPGVAHKKLMKMVRGEDLDQGLGQKLHDFIDSAIGKKTRTYYGDDPRFGSPVAADLWSQRDFGRVDPTSIANLAKLFGDRKIMVNGKSARFVPTDFRKAMDSRSDPEAATVPHGYEVHYDDGTVDKRAFDAIGNYADWDYEAGAKWLQDLASHLSETQFLGKKDWEPKHVQALGWIGTQMAHGTTPQHPERIFQDNTQRSALEFEPGMGTPLHKKYGERFANLPPDKKAKISEELTNWAVSQLSKHTGVHVVGATHGPGGWMKWNNPSMHLETVGAPDQLQAFRGALAHLLQQTEVFGLQPHPKGSRSGMAFMQTDGGSHLRDPEIAAEFARRLALEVQRRGVQKARAEVMQDPKLTPKQREEKLASIKSDHYARLHEGYSPVTDRHGNPGLIFMNMAYPEGYMGSPEYYAGGKYKRDPKKVWTDKHDTVEKLEKELKKETDPERQKYIKSKIEQTKSSRDTYDDFQDALASVMKEMGIRSGDMQSGYKANITSARNDWEKDPTGAGHYPETMEPESRARLHQHVEHVLAPQLERRLAALLDASEAQAGPGYTLPKAEKRRLEETPSLAARAYDYLTGLAEVAEGIPVTGGKGVGFVKESADAYRAMHGPRFGLDPVVPPAFYHALDEKAAAAAAAETDKAEHRPLGPKVQESYQALKDEVAAQWDHIHNHDRVRAEPWTREGQPYQSSREMMEDVARNKHLYFFTGGDIPADHPLAEIHPGTGLPLMHLFLAVHDYYGHAKEGYQFGPRGEENAWIEHSKMFSPAARPAMTAETKMQNNWVNYGPHLMDEKGNIPQKGEPGFVHPVDRPYAEQRAFIPSKKHVDPAEYYKRQGWDPEKVNLSEKVRLIHYSSVPGIQQLDPMMAGTSPTASRLDKILAQHPDYVPHSWFYREDSPHETALAGTHPHAYAAEVDPATIYNAYTDHMGLSRAAPGVGMDKWLRTMQAAKEHGFHGITNTHPDNPHNGRIQMFYPTPVRAIEHPGANLPTARFTRYLLPEETGGTKTES